MTASRWTEPAKARLSDDARRSALVVQLVSLAFGAPPEEVAGETRTRAAALARHAALYLAHVALAIPMDRIGAVFRMNRTSVGYACRVVEDRRDDPVFDEAMSRLEACLRCSPAVAEKGA